MEKVWEELKKIENQAEQIRIEAQSKSKQIISLAQKQAEKLVTNSSVYAEEESKEIYRKTLEIANKKREEQIKKNQEEMKKIKSQGQRGMKIASEAIVKAVLGDGEALDKREKIL